MILYIQKVTLLNVLFVWLLSFRYKIYTSKLTPSWLSYPRINLLLPHKLFSSDEWLILHDQIFDNWKNQIFPTLRNSPKCIIKYQNRLYDFTTNLWQRLGQDYENVYLFLATVKRHQESNPLAHEIHFFLPLRDVNYQLSELFPSLNISKSRLYNYCELFFEWLVSIGYLLRTTKDFLVSLPNTRFSNKRKRIFWSGISPQEIPFEEKRLSFFWGVQYNHLKTEDILYFLPIKPTSAQRSFLNKYNIDFCDQSCLFYRIKLLDKLKLLLGIYQRFLITLLLAREVTAALSMQFFARAIPWSALIKSYKPEQYFTTISYSWPERPEVAVLKAHGVRNVIWAYSANSIRFTQHNSNFRDLSIARSVLTADEFWVWNEALKKWLENRQVLEISSQPKFLVTGPLMCGDINWLSYSPEEVRQNIELPAEGFFVGVFDVPSVSELWRKKFGGGPPLISVEYSEAFFKGIELLLESFPKINILLKLKRNLNDKLRAYPPTLLKLIDPEQSTWVKNKRLHLLRPDIDPYIAIAACNGAIGVPYTSPVLVAISSGRYGIYFDSLAKANYSPAPSLKLITIQNNGDLVITIQNWLNSVINQTNTELHNILPPIIHPTKLFSPNI